MAKPYGAYASPQRGSNSPGTPASASPSPASSSSINSSPYNTGRRDALRPDEEGFQSESSAQRFLNVRSSNQSSRLNSDGSSSGSAGSLPTRSLPRKSRTVVLLGFSMTGKTAICVRFAHGRFEDVYEPTYENSFVRVLNHRGSDVEITLKDTQGLGDQDVFRNEYGLGVHGYALVYSIASARSFAIVQAINAKLTNLMGTTRVPRVLIGAKADLGPSLRQVSTEAGQSLANTLGCAFLECSAKDDVGIDRAFSLLLDEIDRAGEPEPSSDGIERCWRSMICCRCCCRGDGDDDASSSSSAAAAASLLSPFSASDAAQQATDRWSNLTRASAWLLLLCSLLSCALALTFAIRSSDEEPQDQLCGYVLASLSLLVCLMSLLGLWSVRHVSPSSLRVFASALLVLVASELTLGVVLMSHVALLASHGVFVTTAVATSVALQAGAAYAALRLASSLNAESNLLRGSPAMSDYHGHYQSLYE